ncbi:hypothetical protein [Devosia sp. Root635]|uniref:hypothetical protein n=1 Tax=Devosia sp. Root635 TaxID=1736575 RepID=UPI0006F6F6D7|nr:hypothetical protein [Devosia sp. Root635]KRA42111.1 hypothetical protein ASD80_10320 [Devosia sp. Root635]
MSLKITPKLNIDVVEVDNPYFSADHAEGPSNLKRIKAVKNLRESAVETLYARGKLDDAQKKAADRFRATWEAAGGAGAGAMDYAQIRVDGGGAKEPISDRQVDAGKALRDCRVLLGRRNYELVVKVAGQGLSFSDITVVDRTRNTMADNLRDALDDLGKMWGIVK